MNVCIYFNRATPFHKDFPFRHRQKQNRLTHSQEQIKKGHLWTEKKGGVKVIKSLSEYRVLTVTYVLKLKSNIQYETNLNQNNLYTTTHLKCTNPGSSPELFRRPVVARRRSISTIGSFSL